MEPAGAMSYAVVRGVLPNPKVRHYTGLPPALTGGEDRRRDMAWAAFVVLHESAEGPSFLIRYAADGEFYGDTWHENAAHAREQAAFEFEGVLGPWIAMPSGTPDPVAHVLAALK